MLKLIKTNPVQLPFEIQINLTILLSSIPHYSWPTKITFVFQLVRAQQIKQNEFYLSVHPTIKQLLKA